MNIPDEVYDAAYGLVDKYRSYDAFVLVAEWARKEALEESAVIAEQYFVQTGSARLVEVAGLIRERAEGEQA